MSASSIQKSQQVKKEALHTDTSILVPNLRQRRPLAFPSCIQPKSKKKESKRKRTEKIQVPYQTSSIGVEQSRPHLGP